MRKAVFTLILLFLVLGASVSAAQEFTDDSGQRIVFDNAFTRIISLYGAHTENLFSLGLNKEIIGVSPSEDYPNAALTKPKFSYRDDPEKFLAAAPDLVLIRPMIFQGYQRLVERLTHAGITVVSLQPDGVDEMFEYLRKLGMLTGRNKEAESVIQTFTTGIDAIRNKAAQIPESERKRVFFESIHRQMKTFTPTAMPVYALETAGGINVASDAKSIRGTIIAQYGKERILAKGPEIDVYLAQTGTMNPVTRDAIVKEPGFGAIKAVANGNIHLINERLVSRPTLRLLDGAERIARILYPERFGNERQEQ
jgi:iron complex transport system substrate-binding protein